MLPVQAIPQESCCASGDAAVNFCDEVCLPYLLAAQNADGGWGFRRGAQSRTEPTAWAAIALAQVFSRDAAVDGALARGLEFLRGSQLVDGSWASAGGQGQGSSVTSLACWAFLAADENREGLKRGLAWLVAERPGDSGKWWRLLRRLIGGKKVANQNEALWGWSWTSGTASWVEPTSYALIVMQDAPEDLLPAGVAPRMMRAEGMLFDRMCPGGGWNCGNPMVYGVAGVPQVSTTVWPLLALRGYAEHGEIQQSLAWLEKNWSGIQSPASLALAQIALNAFDRGNGTFARTVQALYEPDAISWTVPTAAWAALAASGAKFWLRAVSAEKGN